MRSLILSLVWAFSAIVCSDFLDEPWSSEYPSLSSLGGIPENNQGSTEPWSLGDGDLFTDPSLPVENDLFGEGEPLATDNSPQEYGGTTLGGYTASDPSVDLLTDCGNDLQLYGKRRAKRGESCRSPPTTDIEPQPGDPDLSPGPPQEYGGTTLGGYTASDPSVDLLTDCGNGLQPYGKRRAKRGESCRSPSTTDTEPQPGGPGPGPGPGPPSSEKAPSFFPGYREYIRDPDTNVLRIPGFSSRYLGESDVCLVYTEGYLPYGVCGIEYFTSTEAFWGINTFTLTKAVLCMLSAIVSLSL